MLGQRGIYRSKWITHGMHERVPPEFFANPLAMILRDDWVTGGLDGSMQDYVDWKGPDWGVIRFRREEVFRFWPPAGRPASPPHVGTDPMAAEPLTAETAAAAPMAGTTTADENRLYRWLTDKMRATPNGPMTKAAIKVAATNEGLRFSLRGFDRVWARAVRDSGAVSWSMPGRRKSPRRIDTAS